MNPSDNDDYEEIDLSAFEEQRTTTANSQELIRDAFTQEAHSESIRQEDSIEDPADNQQNIQVYLRIRPPTHSQRAICLERTDFGHALLKKKSLLSDKFKFARVFQGETQQEVFSCVEPVVTAVLEGFNGSILAYGQTASGKTYSMTGPPGGEEDPELKGVIPRVSSLLFRLINHRTAEGTAFEVYVSYLEVYMEKVRDLLQPITPAARKNTIEKQKIESLRVIDVDDGKGVLIQGSKQVRVRTQEEFEAVVRQGEKGRMVGATGMNERSSRGHVLCAVTVVVRYLSRYTCGQLYLVDLAGSEKVSKTGAEGLTLEEAKLINLSLHSLGNVISALTTIEQQQKKGKRTDNRHVPYRDSKLTRILRNSFGGNAKTAVLIHCSPEEYNYGETYNTLLFGQKMQSIVNVARVNAEVTVESLKNVVAHQKKWLYYFRQDVETLLGVMESVVGSKDQFSRFLYSKHPRAPNIDQISSVEYTASASTRQSSSSSSSCSSSTSSSSRRQQTPRPQPQRRSSATRETALTGESASASSSSSSSSTTTTSSSSSSSSSPSASTSSFEPQHSSLPDVSVQQYCGQPLTDKSVNFFAPLANPVVEGLEGRANVIEPCVYCGEPLTAQTRAETEKCPVCNCPFDDVPYCFLCPISRTMMVFPVLAFDGFTYERACIEAWFKNHQTSPMTGKKVNSRQLLPNHNLTSQIKASRFFADYVKARAELGKENLLRTLGDLRTPNTDPPPACENDAFFSNRGGALILWRISSSRSQAGRRR